MAKSYDYARLEVRWSDAWIWQVHENQAYLGRIVLRLKRRVLGSLAELTAKEWMHLLHELRLFEQTMKVLFRPDRFNYGQLGNIYHQLHVHAVPRYRSPRNWARCTFKDVRWGKNWAPTPRSPLTRDEAYAFAAWLREQMPLVLPTAHAKRFRGEIDASTS